MAKETDDYDFGFEFADDMTEAVDTAQTKAQQIYDAIMPLLNNLKLNPLMPYKSIQWKKTSSAKYLLKA